MLPGRLTGALTLSLILAATAHAMEQLEQRAFDLPAGGTVVIDTYRGPITVLPQERRDVMVTVRAQAPHKDEARARAAIDRLELQMIPQDGGLVVTVRNPRETGVRFIWDETARLDVEIEVLVPMHCNLGLRTNEGGITVGNLTGRITARTEAGTIFFRQIDGSVEAHNRNGDIIVSRCTGLVTLRTVTGDVRIGTVGGRAVLETLNGNIEVQTAHDQIMAQAAEGDIEAGFAQIADGSRLKTSFGNIKATFNPDEAFQIHATARWGRVSSDLPLEELSGATGRGRLVGQHNGGGPRVDLLAGGGQVNIVPGRPLFDL